MSEPVIPTRRVDYRVAIPLQQPIPSRPSLIPADVWRSYQQEVARAKREESERHQVDAAASPVGEDELEFVSAEYDIGLAATTSADPEVAYFALSQVSLFSALPRESLEAMVKDSRQGEIASGEYLFLEGDSAESFFVVVDGTVEIIRRRDEREVVLRHMGRGEAIGLFGLFSGKMRAACARAIGEAVVLEVPCATLGRIVQADQAFNERLLKFYQERLLEGFLGSSKLFTDVDPIARARMIGRFRERALRAQETLVQPGEVSNLLGVLISGRVMLELRPRAGQQQRLFELLPGQFVAVTSAMSGAPSRMRIWAAEASTVSILGHRELADLLRDYPALRGLSARLPGSARELDRDVYCGHTGVPGL
ncbi:MAG: cyclic nucleotide-binding domain-containing protein [Myxococcales bacterium]|nr:cyclic nucleotide-binding domain-containing protein [Myxococcales bacterium]